MCVLVELETVDNLNQSFLLVDGSSVSEAEPEGGLPCHDLLT